MKRNNWTNEEVVDILKGQMLCVNEGADEAAQKQVDDWNTSLSDAIEYFSYHFSVSDDDYSALAYDTEKKQIFHIGQILPK